MSAAKRWQAPAEDGGVLVDPPFSEVPRLLDENRRRLAADCLILGRPLREWRSEYCEQWSVERGEFGPKSFVMCGHQPELIHPGVLIKNFAIAGLAHRHGLTSINLEIDTDTIKTTSLRLPVWHRDPARVHTVELPFDRWSGESPYQSRLVLDQNLFYSMSERAQEICRHWGFTPLLSRFWDEVTKLFNGKSRRGPFLVRHIGECLSKARFEIECQWGTCNINGPVSCFLRRQCANAFFAQILDDLAGFHRIYNDCLRAFRQRLHLRSGAHPVPDLATDGDLLEAPFWLFDSNAGQRSRLLLRQRGDQIELYSRPKATPIVISRGRENAFAEMNQQGLFIHTRALTTTMFARLFLCDLFVHGIGGGIYDELTDDIIRRYFGIEPPHYMVVSGTLRLPFPEFPGTPGQCRRLRQELRDLEWNPQRYVDTGKLATERERWRAMQPADSAGRRERFRALQTLTTKMRQLVPVAEFERRQARLEQCEREVAANAILRRRDYAFCLYPEELLKPFCTQFLHLP